MESKQFDQLKGLISGLNNAIGKLTTQVSAISGGVQQSTQSFTDITQQLMGIADQLNGFTKQIDHLNMRVSSLEQGIEAVGGQVADAAQQMTMIEDELEQSGTKADA
jgi:prefoldin subunit 5